MGLSALRAFNSLICDKVTKASTGVRVSASEASFVLWHQAFAVAVQDSLNAMTAIYLSVLSRAVVVLNLGISCLLESPEKI